MHSINPRRALSAAALSEPSTATSTSNDTFGQFDLGQLQQQVQYQQQPQYEQKPAYSVEINHQAMGSQDLSRVTQLLAYLPAVLSDPTLALELNKIQELVNLGYLQWEQALKWAQELSERAGGVNHHQQQQLPAVSINITNSTPASYSASPLHDLAYALPANANNTELQVQSFVSSSYSYVSCLSVVCVVPVVRRAPRTHTAASCRRTQSESVGRLRWGVHGGECPSGDLVAAQAAAEAGQQPQCPHIHLVHV
jgi:hypothetical protein